MPLAAGRLRLGKIDVKIHNDHRERHHLPDTPSERRNWKGVEYT